ASPLQSELTSGLRGIHSQRVEFVGLVQETFQRCPFDDRVSRAQQNRLADLVIPAAHAEWISLEPIQVQALAEEIVPDRLEFGRLAAQNRLDHSLDRRPCRPVFAAHAPPSGLFEAAVELRGAM